MRLGRRRGRTESVFVVWWYRCLVAATFTLQGAVFLSLAIDSANSVTRVLGTASAVVMVGLVVRSLRCATVRVSDAGVVVQGLRVRRIPWRDIEGTGVGRGSTMLLGNWRVPCIELRDGAVICADEVRSLRERSIVDDVVGEIERRLSSSSTA